MMDTWTPTDSELPAMLSSDPAQLTLKHKLSPLAIDWLSALMEITEPVRQTT